jgi:hypothetical protein
MEQEQLTLKKVFVFWVPLAATWLMMAVEGPFLAAVIARLADPKPNLAAYGVAFSIAVLVESPIIMMMTASTALVKDRLSLLKLRNFTYALNGGITLIMGLILVPPLFTLIAEKLLNLPGDVAHLTHLACLLLLPWPAAIGYRRFYQGILIRSNLTRRVAYGTVVRLSAMILTALVCFTFSSLRGAVVGALALSIGVCSEAVASKLMARHAETALLSRHSPQSSRTPLTYRYIGTFYYPLALTSMLGLGAYPIVTFFMGHSCMAIESLAVLPVVNALVFIFRSMGLSFQEVGVALLGEKKEGYKPLRDFAGVLGFSVTAALAVIAFTPLASIWFREISGLSAELYRIAVTPTRIMTVMPGLMVLLSFQRALLVNSMNTRPINTATMIEVTGIVVFLIITVNFLDLIGAWAAAISLLLGRLFANTYLFAPYWGELNKLEKPAAVS